MGRLGDKETWGRGDLGTRRLGDEEIGRRGDWETRRRGDGVKIFSSDFVSVSQLRICFISVLDLIS